jgi:hypothetical protein
VKVWRDRTDWKNWLLPAIMAAIIAVAIVGVVWNRIY